MPQVYSTLKKGIIKTLNIVLGGILIFSCCLAFLANRKEEFSTTLIINYKITKTRNT